MSQHSFSIANEAGAAFRGDVNSGLQALASLSSGAAAPATTTRTALGRHHPRRPEASGTPPIRAGWCAARSTRPSSSPARRTPSSPARDFAQDFHRHLELHADAHRRGDARRRLVRRTTERRHRRHHVIDPNGAETIDGQTTLALRSGESATLYGNGASFQLANRSRYAGALAAGRNLAARTDATTPNSKFNITADELQLKDANGNVFVATSVSLTVDMAASGANGLDTGAEASSTWYYGWVVAKEDGTVAGLSSVSSSAPTLPAGYTYKALATAVRNDGSSNFIKYRQFGNSAHFEVRNSVLSAGTATTETSVTISSFVPPIAEELFGDIATTVVANAAGGQNETELRVVSASTYAVPSCAYAEVGATQSKGDGSYLVPNTGTFLYLNVATGAPTTVQSSLWVGGFKLPLGGE
jgi:hypothetical protein